MVDMARRVRRTDNQDERAEAAPDRLARATAVTLAVGLTLSVLAGLAVGADANAESVRTFGVDASAARTALERRIAAYAEALFGLRGLFASTAEVSRAGFAAYATVSNLSGRLPGVQALYFGRHLPVERTGDLERRVRADIGPGGRGFPSFRVFPRTTHDDVYVIDTIEPFQPNNAAFGFDAGSDPARRAAIEDARDSGDLAATAPITRLEGPGQRGFLLYLAIYAPERAPRHRAARRESITGVVAAVIRTADLVEEALATFPRARIEEIYDVGPANAHAASFVDPANALIDVTPSISALRPGSLPRPSVTQDLTVGTRRWRALFVPRADASARTILPWMAALVGLAMTLLLAMAIQSFVRTRARAVVIAARMTEDLRAHEHDLEAANDALAAANARLEDRNETIREFVAVASHDMRTPLTAIIGYGRLLTSDWERIDDATKRRSLDTIASRAEHLARIVDDLLVDAEIESGLLEARREPTDVGRILTEIIQGYAERSGDIVGHHPDAPLAFVEPDHLSRILTNLIDNALKYGAPPVRVQARGDVSWVEITVQDAGAGVPPDFVPRLFDKFSRHEGTDIGRRVEGTGLGLSIVRGLARANGGDATYEPSAPAGRFVVRLPAPPPDEDDARETA